MKLPAFRTAFFPAILAFFVAAPVSRAQVVVFDNIGDSGSFHPVIGYTVAVSPFQEVAMKFTAAAGGFLDYADLRLAHVSGTNLVNIALLANSAADTPGAVLETNFTFAFDGASTMPVTHVEFSKSTLLTAGTIYWLALSPFDETTHFAWEHGGLPLGAVVFDSAGLGFTDPWGTPVSLAQPGVRIVAVAAVPEPSTYGLMAGALLMALLAFRRRIGS